MMINYCLSSSRPYRHGVQKHRNNILETFGISLYLFTSYEPCTVSWLYVLKQITRSCRNLTPSCQIGYNQASSTLEAIIAGSLNRSLRGQHGQGQRDASRLTHVTRPTPRKLMAKYKQNDSPVLFQLVMSGPGTENIQFVTAHRHFTHTLHWFTITRHYTALRGRLTCCPAIFSSWAAFRQHESPRTPGGSTRIRAPTLQQRKLQFRQNQLIMARQKQTGAMLTCASSALD